MDLTTIVLADDHHIVRASLRALLETEARFSVIGETADGRQAVNLVAQLRPHVLIVDLMMPGLTGLEVTRQVRRRAPATRIVILSMHRHATYVLEALHCGATAYVLKNSGAGGLIAAVHAVMRGRRYLSPPLSEDGLDAYAEKGGTTPLTRYEMLTMREREVLVLAAQGHHTDDIATRMGISPRTVEFHRANLIRKMGLRTQTDLVTYALRCGIIPGVLRTSGP